MRDESAGISSDSDLNCEPCDLIGATPVNTGGPRPARAASDVTDSWVAVVVGVAGGRRVQTDPLSTRALLRSCYWSWNRC